MIVPSKILFVQCAFFSFSLASDPQAQLLAVKADLGRGGGRVRRGHGEMLGAVISGVTGEKKGSYQRVVMGLSHLGSSQGSSEGS